MVVNIVNVFQPGALKDFLIFCFMDSLFKECVAVLTVLYKKNGAVSCVVSDFLSDLSLYTTNPQPIVVQFAGSKKEHLS